MKLSSSSFRVHYFALLAIACLVSSSSAQDKASSKDKDGAKAKPAASTLGEPQLLDRFARDYDIWIDQKRKLVVVDGKIALRDGYLEMFACPKGTKEHESIVAVNCNAHFIHAALIAIGANPGHPVSFTPEYKAATGPVIEVFVLWKDEQGKNHKVRAQEWIQNTKTNQPMEHSWVFAGSNVFVDEETGKKSYLADGGDLICVSNFTSAMLDLPVPSSDSTAGLNFRAFTQRIPPLGTPVRLVLQPLTTTDKAPATDKEKPKAKDK